MRRRIAVVACAAVVAMVASGAPVANQGRYFQRVGTFANFKNNQNPATVTVSEIIAASADGKTLVYTDALMGDIGFIDITDPANPKPAGKLSFPEPHEPTSVDVLGNKYALVAVDSSVSKANPSGYLAVVDLASQTIVRTLQLGGQPDSLKISHDHRFAAIAIENERNENLCVGGTFNGREDVSATVCASGGGVRGGLPQSPAGFLAVVRLTGPQPDGWTVQNVSLNDLAAYGTSDPEPEFVDINQQNQAVVTLQENNHIAVVDLETGTILNHFPAGTVTLAGIDRFDDGAIKPVDTLTNVAREPDGVTWLPGGTIATANEGDLFGGSRGFSIFDAAGNVTYDSGIGFDRMAMRFGHYPDDRSDNKGTEPESVAYAKFGPTDYLFVGSERGNFVSVYELVNGTPRFLQVLPGPFGPEGLLVIPHRNLVVLSGENDMIANDPLSVRSTVMIYELRNAPPTYPQIASIDKAGTPIAWSALSGLSAIPGDDDHVYGVWDSYYVNQPRVFRINVSTPVAIVNDFVEITGGSGNYDLEGITVAPDGSIWVASEGNATDTRPNRLLKLNAQGQVQQEIGLPPEVINCRAATTNRGTLGSGFEGVAAIPNGANYRLFVAQQRGWDYTTPGCEAIDDENGDLRQPGNEPSRSRIWIYDPFESDPTKKWTWISWQLAPRPVNAVWVGLSEITLTPSGELILIERDNRTGDFGVLKTLALVPPSSWADGVILSPEKVVRDIRPAIAATNGWITDKPEGVAAMADGRLFVVTDNDGVEEWSGESWFLRLGQYVSYFF